MDIKEKFEKMCEFINTGENGLFYPYIVEDFIDELYEFKVDPDYTVLRKKMDNLIVLVNSDNSMIDKDISEELWDLI